MPLSVLSALPLSELRKLLKTTKKSKDFYRPSIESRTNTTKVLDTGGYGCILNPAIVFKDSEEVTYENRHLYVTKLARDAQKEYDVAMYIKSKCPDVGIYPVDNLECGVGPHSVNDPKAWNKIFNKCQNQKQLLKKSPNQQYLCALQYPKYDGTFEILRIPTNQKLIESFISIAYQQLLTLHANNIFHLDIKDANISFTELANGYIDIRFADWGFTKIVPDGKILTDLDSIALVEKNLLKALRPLNYYIKLFPSITDNYNNDVESKITMADVSYHILREVLKDLEKKPQTLNLHKVRYFYMYLDMCCFAGMQCKYIPHAYDELIDVIAEMIYEPYYINDKAEKIDVDEKWRIPLDGIAESFLKRRIEKLYAIKKELHIFNAFEKPE
jgi:hypothetical protein